VKLHLYAIPVLLSMTLGPAVFAQEPAPAPKPATDKPAAVPPPAAQPRGPVVPLKLNVVVSKYQNDKKLSSLPYSISVNSNNSRVSMRMGAQVPYATSNVSEGKPVPGYSYRDVGVRIDAQASVYEPGLYRVDLTVEDTSISTSSQVQGAPSISGVPIFKNFSAFNTVMLKDGQTTQLTTAADPISGETMRVDVTLTVAK
jgi:hypothetical protein